MQLNDISFGVTDWQVVVGEKHAGEQGMAVWKTRLFDDIRVREVTYSAGYLADHWCKKGHILFCLEGEMVTELEDGRTFTLKAGMSYQVADHAEAHRSSTISGARLFIVD
ncbi:hypothetical protein HA49_16160 [Tatumella morbirosei]|uniref:DHCW motif cupin fold protein n=1 Tax=Tatumella morbirosei TaxID=642227 RepID=A0A095T6H2_9GAMM|nr:DHCW motif cupin fold protein [Tatumella morbirosei]KGD72277.1 hypothetical protein HA49_16160 [Tatumella morbirosei]